MCTDPKRRALQCRQPPAPGLPKSEPGVRKSSYPKSDETDVQTDAYVVWSGTVASRVVSINTIRLNNLIFSLPIKCIYISY